ncbi:hypothetical protein BDZ94DRAFT_1203254 [Collybia nuda]|uniref:Uncharacterized protein n=1 Tax=Collybia nuda TaxID=64659 RepID=A0A9P5XT84_9AGAR|nr:hypothetical protein BDZ94DRAFT_1203254 [Collybia nuda]
MFSSTLTTFFLAAVTATLVRSAPTPALDNATLLKNGQAAQKLNTLFQAIKETDPCTNEDKACISGGVAVCVQGKWKTSGGQCSATQKCFALPSVREAGTLVTCTSEKSALSAIEASGASGGLFGTATRNSSSTTDDSSSQNAASTTISAIATSSSAADEPTQTASPDNDDGDNGDECDMECEDEDDPDSETATPVTATSSPASESTPTSASTSGKSAESTATPSDDGTGPVTVTVTLTAQPTTFAPQTRTLSPEDASSVLSSLMANGATIIISPSASGSSDVKEPLITTVPTAQSSGTTLSQPAPTTVPLTAAASASAMSAGGYDY